MTIHAPRSGFSRWLKWLLVLLVLLIAAGVIWRVAGGKRGAVPGDLPPGGHRGAAQMSGPAKLVHSG
ncbi:multidrug transporter subunit MdtA, partial [Pantoea dispersa]